MKKLNEEELSRISGGIDPQIFHAAMCTASFLTAVDGLDVGSPEYNAVYELFQEGSCGDII